MANDEIKTRITVDGDQAKQELQKVAAEEKKLAQTTEQAGKHAEQSAVHVGRLHRAWNRFRDVAGSATGLQRRLGTETKRLGNNADRAAHSAKGLGKAWEYVKSNVMGMVTGFAGIAALTALLQANRQEMEQDVQVTERLAKAQRDLEFMSQNASMSKRDRRIVRQAAKLMGGPDAMETLTATFTALEGQTANMSDKQRIKLFQQMVEMSMVTSAPISDLTSLFAKGSQYVTNPQRLQNLIAETQIQSPDATASQIALYLPDLLAVGAAAGLTPAQSAGTFAYAENVAGSSEKGATSLRNIILFLQGRLNPQGAQVLKRLGVKPHANLFEQIHTLGQAMNQGKLSLGDLDNLVGTDSAAVLYAMVQHPRMMTQTVGAVVNAANSPKDITRDKLRQMLKNNPTQAWYLKELQTDAKIEIQRTGNKNARQADLVGKELDLELRRQGKSTAVRTLEEWGYDIATGFGTPPNLTALAVGGAKPGDPGANAVIRSMAPADTDVNQIGQPQTVVQHQTVNNTTVHHQINNAHDPATAGLTGVTHVRHH